MTTGEQERRDKANEFYAPVKSIKGAPEEEKQRKQRPLMTFILKPFHLSRNPIKRYSVG